MAATNIGGARTAFELGNAPIKGREPRADGVVLIAGAQNLDVL